MKLSAWTQIISILLVASSFSLLAEAGQSTLQNGKLNLTWASPKTPHCVTVKYPQRFPGSQYVRVLASISQGEKSPNVHHFAVVWTVDVTTASFRVCVMESGLIVAGSVEVNWLAFQGNPTGMLSGGVSFPVFTSGTICARVNFVKRLQPAPKVLATVRHSSNKSPKDAIHMWIEELLGDHFRICVREVITFDGKHQDITVDWLAVSRGANEFTFHGKLELEKTTPPPAKDTFAHCKVLNFTETFFAPPVVIVTTNHLYNSRSRYSVKPENNVIASWIQDITVSAFSVCVKDLAGLDTQQDAVTVDFVAIGDLDPCINVSCNYYAVCKAFGPSDARCVCSSKCPSFVEPVCSSNGTTYDNKCVFQREMCRMQANHTLYHPGMCTGFTTQKGRHRLHHSPSWAEVVCEQVSLSPYVFYPDKPVHVQVSVNHANSSNPRLVHEASVAWVEEIHDSNFTVCVTLAGRNEDDNGVTFASVDWLAYQGAPDGGVSGKMDMPTWWTGTSCQTVFLPSGAFKSAPTILLSAEHKRSGVKHDAATVWAEDVTSSCFKICVRELQNFDGAHENIHINWLVFDRLHQPLLQEHGALQYSSLKKPSKVFNYAFCKDVTFKTHYKHSPTVLVTANHSTNGGRVNPLYNSISAWVEYIKVTGFRACVKELYVNQHDPLSVSYAVMSDVCDPGWSFYNGSCYFTSKECGKWSVANKVCKSMGAKLVAIKSQEENVYVQQRHNGAKAWIGLNDISREGLFTWVDGSSDKFRYWAPNQPSNFRGKDCVHTLGVDHGYMWSDVDCSSCHQYTCEKVYDECVSSPCLNGGTCINKKGNFSCICARSFTGRTCEVPAAASCKALMAAGYRSSGTYYLNVAGYTLQVYCDMSSNGGGWTLISRFSNRDGRNWMQSSGNWWYDKSSSYGSTTSPSNNYDMISPAFWLVTGYRIKISRSDDSSNSALLYTSTSCIGGKTFRSLITSFGNFRNGQVWNSNRCRGSCNAYFGGRFSSTVGFSQASCSSNLQSANRISFWCDWSGGDGAVMMIGGGGSTCKRADHGIGVTEANEAKFDPAYSQADFGDDSTRITNSYSLNLWIR